jgi:hypothetical protein
VSVPARDRLTNCYYAVMVAAMAWMYALMTGSLPGQTDHPPDHALAGSLDMNMSGIEMPATEMSQPVHGPGWITGMNWIATLGFAVVALYWAYRYVAERRTNPVPHAPHLTHLEPLYKTLTAAGTALMFGVML